MKRRAGSSLFFVYWGWLLCWRGDASIRGIQSGWLAIADRIHHEQEYQPLLQRAARTPLLLIDDLDKPKPSEFRESVYYFLFNQRNRAGLPLAITCNCHPRELDRWIGGAARSRIMQGLVPVLMNGPDYRMQKGLVAHEFF